MNDWQVLILEELKALNRKIERLDDKLDADHVQLMRNVAALEHEIEEELKPIKKHVTQVRFASVLLPSLFTLAGVISRLMP